MESLIFKNYQRNAQESIQGVAEFQCIIVESNQLNSYTL